MKHDAMYHEFDSEALYNNLQDYRQYLEECADDAESDSEMQEIDEELFHVVHIIDKMQEWFDCV